MAWDASAADCHAGLRARSERRGTPIGVLDTLIAALAFHPCPLRPAFRLQLDFLKMAI
jgi:hypothetical protein